MTSSQAGVQALFRSGITHLLDGDRGGADDGAADEPEEGERRHVRQRGHDGAQHADAGASRVHPHRLL